MIQILISIIEWFAIVALSMVGIDYDPAKPCIPTEQAAEPAAIVYYTTDRIADMAIRASDCASATLIPVEISPVEIKSRDTYDS